jgi:hypothetical protein
MADPNKWGSLVWKILHIQSEYLGKQTIQMLKNDERILINKFLKQISYILPCSTCKKHYNDYYMNNNSNNIEYKDINTFLINYFYNLHNSVNERNNKPLFNKEDLIIYKQHTKQEYSILLKEFEQLFKKVYAIRYYISIDAVNDFLMTIRKLRQITGF